MVPRTSAPPACLSCPSGGGAPAVGFPTSAVSRQKELFRLLPEPRPDHLSLFCSSHDSGKTSETLPLWPLPPSLRSRYTKNHGDIPQLPGEPVAAVEVNESGSESGARSAARWPRASSLPGCCGRGQRPAQIPRLLLTVSTTFPALCSVSTYRVASTTSS